MALEGITFDRMRVTPIDDALLYEILSRGENRLMDTYGTKFEATTTGLNVYLEKGAAIVEGRLVRNTDQLGVSIVANTKGWIVITIDLTKTNTSTGTPGTGDYLAVNNQVRIEAVTTLTTQNLHDGGKLFNYPLYTYTSTGSAVTVERSLPAVDNRLTIMQAADIKNAPVARTNINLSLTTPNDSNFAAVGDGTMRVLREGYYRMELFAECVPSIATENKFRRIGWVAKRGEVEVPYLATYGGGNFYGGTTEATLYVQLIPGDIISATTNGGAIHPSLSYIRGFCERM